MSKEAEVAAHYGRGGLLETIEAALLKAGKDLEQLTVQDLAPLDHFHGGGQEASDAMAALLPVAPEHHLLDVGSGIGGPARYFAARFGCKVTGIDLTEEFCQIAGALTQRVGLSERVDFRHGSALELPFDDASFDGVYTQYVAMNIADRARFYGEIHRVLKPGGFLAAAELAQGPQAAPTYPLPWAATPETSFLLPPEETRRVLEAIGFAVTALHDRSAAMSDILRRQKERLEDEGPPILSTRILLGAQAQEKQRHVAQGVQGGCLIPIEFACRKA